MKTCQTLARHSTPSLTIGIYAKASLHDINGAVENLPDLTAPRPQPEALRMTGTDGVLPSATQTVEVVPDEQTQVECGQAIGPRNGMENGSVARPPTLPARTRAAARHAQIQLSRLVASCDSCSITTVLLRPVYNRIDGTTRRMNSVIAAKPHPTRHRRRRRPSLATRSTSRLLRASQPRSAVEIGGGDDWDGYPERGAQGFALETVVLGAGKKQSRDSILEGEYRRMITVRQNGAANLDHPGDRRHVACMIDDVPRARRRLP